VFELAVVGLDRIVHVSLDVVPRLRDQLVEHPGVDRRGVGDDLARRFNVDSVRRKNLVRVAW
jgi:hypothetical protein